MKPDELRRYAEMIVKGCIAFRRGDTLLAAGQHRAPRARGRGRRGRLPRRRAAVDVEYDDTACLRRAHPARREDRARPAHVVAARAHAGARQRGGRDRAGDGRDRAGVRSPTCRPSAWPRTRSGSPPARRWRGSGARARLRGTICAWPTDDWAHARLSRADAGRRRGASSRPTSSGSAGSARRTRPATRAGPQHLAALRRRAARLTKLDLKEVHVRDRGTDLRLKIAPYSMWRGGGEQDHWGRQIAMNVPTEECFISPDAAATEGTFRCSRPRSFGGRVIEELAGEFRGGRLVRLKAKREADRDWLARLPRRDPERRPARRDRAGRRLVADRPDGPHLLQRPARRERRRAHGVRLRLREDAHRADRPEALRRQPVEDAHRRDDRHRRARTPTASRSPAAGCRLSPTASWRF